MAEISDKAAVDPRAIIADDAYIGPFCVVGPEVTIGHGTRLENNVTVTGRVTLCDDNRVYPQVVLGAEPQDLSSTGERTYLSIGSHNVIRECVTINRGTEKENGVTVVGNHCYLMACSHIAHDCRVGDRVVIANGTLLGGHVHVHDHATVSGNAGVHHFTTLGRYSFVSGLSRVLQDVPPFMLVDGVPTRPRCVNVVGLRRSGFSEEVIRALTEAHRLLFRGRIGLDHAREVLRNEGQLVPAVNELLGFVQDQQEGRHGRSRDHRRAA